MARALANQPLLVLADEPTGSLDAETSWDVMCLFESMRQQGTTVLIATHDLSLVRRVGHRVLALNAGRLVGA